MFDLHESADLLRLLCDPTRVRLLSLLASDELTVAELTRLKDLKFRNNHSEAVVLQARADSANETVAAQFVSRAHLGASIRIESRILREIVPPAGGDGVSGWEVVTTRYASTDHAERITYRAVDLYQPTSPPRR